MPTDPREAFSRAKRLLTTHGFSYHVSLEELEDWLESPTAHPYISSGNLLQKPLLVAHEIVEIAELKKMGLRITSDLVRTEPDRVYDAHLKAYEVELALAVEVCDQKHIKSRLGDVRSWAEDTKPPPKLRLKCAELLAETKDAVK